MGYAWRREASNILKCVGRYRKKKLKDIVQAMPELVTLAEENFDIKKSWLNLGKQIMNLRNAREF